MSPGQDETRICGYVYVYIYIYIYIYYYIIYKMGLQGFSNSFLKIKWKETLINVTYNDQIDKSSEIHIGETITKGFWWSCKKAYRKLWVLAPATP